MKQIIEILLVWAFACLSFSGCKITEAENPTNDILPTVMSTEEIQTVLKKEISPKYEPVYTKVHDEKSEIYIWNELSKYSPNDQITAGVMGYFWKESRMRSDAVAGWDVRNRWKGQETDICQEFTKDIDSGLKHGSTKDYFKEMVTTRYGGYGLGQWLSLDYLDDLYEFSKRQKTSIGDARMQCEFIFYSMKKNEKLWTELMNCRTAEQCGRRIGTLYDGNDETGAELIASAAGQYYKTFHLEAEK